MIPLSLYIHVPWCIRKCPYCDFNSHQSPEHLPEKTYIEALLADLSADLARFSPRSLHTIFIGGGTPSLLSPEAYASLFQGIKMLLPYEDNIEITLEANPGTVDEGRFHEYRALGINRLSLGVQSFNSQHLKVLGRIHDAVAAHRAIDVARKAGFSRLNLDLMHGLPGQSIEDALLDLDTAINHQPEHLSWYQLTLEPNTIFYKKRPILPDDDVLATIEDEGFSRLAAAQFQRYEISAFCREGEVSLHNLNYWLFGDYLGIGAGAHGKYTTLDGIYRTRKQRQPRHYLEQSPLAETKRVEEHVFEFMLNTTRLQAAIPYALSQERIGVDIREEAAFHEAVKKELIVQGENTWQVTALGRRFTNNLQVMFLG